MDEYPLLNNILPPRFSPFTLLEILADICYIAKYKVPQSTSKWARYINKEIIVKPLSPYKSREVFA